jgi:hypothetical protein
LHRFAVALNIRSHTDCFDGEAHGPALAAALVDLEKEATTDYVLTIEQVADRYAKAANVAGIQLFDLGDMLSHGLWRDQVNLAPDRGLLFLAVEMAFGTERCRLRTVRGWSAR